MAEPAKKDDNGGPNASAIAKGISQGLLFGLYKFATYNNASHFIKEALNGVPTPKKGWTVGRVLWSPVGWACSRIGWNYDKSLSDMSVKEFLRLQLPIAARAVVVCITEGVIMVVERELEKKVDNSAYIVIFLRFIGRMVQMGTVGWYEDGRRGLVVGAILAFVIHAGEFAATVYMDRQEKERYIDGEQKLLGALSLASFLPTVRSTVSSFIIPESLRAIAASPVAAALILMTLITDYQQMRDQRVVTITLGAARIAILAAVLGYAVGFNPRASLVMGAPGIVMWAVHSSMAYYYDW